MVKGMGGPVPLRKKDIYKRPIRFKRQIQNTDLYRSQRNYALMRCKNKCEKCNAAVGELSPKGNLITQFDMHHIEEFDSIIARFNISTVAQARLCPILWDVNNVQILCHDCHTETDSYGKGKS